MDAICHSHSFPITWEKTFINILQGHDNPTEHISKLTWDPQMKKEIPLFSLNVLFYCRTQSCQLQGWFCTVHHSLFGFFKLFISIWMEKISVYHCGINTVRFPKRELHQRKKSLWYEQINFMQTTHFPKCPVLRLPLVAWSILGLLNFSAPGFSGSRKYLFFRTRKNSSILKPSNDRRSIWNLEKYIFKTSLF